MILGHPPFHVDGQKGCEGGHRPHSQYHPTGPALGQQRLVAQWPHDRQVAVKGYDAQSLDACRHAQHVCRKPEIAEKVPKVPFIKKDIASAEGHNKKPHDQVGTRQRADEAVSDGL